MSAQPDVNHDGCPVCPQIVKMAPLGEFWSMEVPDEEQDEEYAEEYAEEYEEGHMEEYVEKDEAPQPEKPPYKTIRVARPAPRKHFYW